MQSLTVENVLGSGSIDAEFDLPEMSEHFDACAIQYDPTIHPAIYLKLIDDGPRIALYRTGSFHISGAKSKRDCLDTYNNFIKLLTETSAIQEETNHNFSIKNVVALGDLNSELELNELAIYLGLNNTEYEPEQFPGLIYRTDDVTYNIFPSGKVVVTGCESIEEAESGFDNLVIKMGEEWVG